MQNIQDEKTNSLQVVKEIYEKDKYFKDTFEWYTAQYLNIYVDRFIFFVLSFLSLIIMTILGLTIKNLYPLKESFPVVINQKDSAKYETKITPLQNKLMQYTNPESMGRYFAINYIKLLTEHNYKNATVNVLNEKLELVKNFSNKDAFEKAQTLINNKFKELYGKNFEQKVIIRTFKFLDRVQGSFEKSIQRDKTIYKAEINYIPYIVSNEILDKKNEKIILTFKFNDIKYDNKTKQFDPVVFTAIDFKIVEMK